MSKLTFRNLIIVVAIAFLDVSICNGREQSSKLLSQNMIKSSTDDHDDVKSMRQHSFASTIFSVIKYGAKGDGKTDDTKALQAAWGDACKVQGSKVLVPSPNVFLVKPTIFSGSNCASNITFQVDGKIIAPQDAGSWAASPQAWIIFQNIKTITFQGNGILDGQGSIWWKGQGNLPSKRPIALQFSRCSDIIVTGITIQNSPLKHLKIYDSVGVQIFGMNVLAPPDSPNTDGINLSMARNVKIHNLNLACGDDCISILGGCSQVEIYEVNCGPGHGFSIGGLGKGNAQDMVSDITARDSIIKNSLTGVRIKTFQGGSGFVKHVNFSNIQVSEVKKAIVIDQYYCDGQSCKNATSVVAISDINFEKIRGTFTSSPVSLACSDSTPCRGITLSTIELKLSGKPSTLNTPFCWKAFGRVLTITSPPITCLQNGPVWKSTQNFYRS